MNSDAIGGPLASDLPKARTGITGLDEITLGGLPRGRPTLVCGSAGCGKTLLAMEFLIRGATEFGEPGACITFEETEINGVAGLIARDRGRTMLAISLDTDGTRVTAIYGMANPDKLAAATRT